MTGVLIIEIVQKGGYMIEKDGIESSKDPGIQHNHADGNCLRHKRVLVPGCGNKILTTSETGMRNREKHKIARMGVPRGNRS